ncbi:hypothetical protein FM076_31370 [Streptomyces albus subsp. chlorinus]|uniref:hypothetical protein n=1 Tax=Streptomyces albus TaxID=1888 RepID=UPI0015708147|nr:hypothetical protein [Streptomyces albus]NSC25411.1 hypothetical protein [Streptomyces albus subsp. chlorinus]
MTDIFTAFIRVYARPPAREWPKRRELIDEVEAQWITWMLLGRSGSYHVPVHTRRPPGGAYVDVQYGSGKSSEIAGFCELPYYQAIWGRSHDEGSGVDVIWRDDVNKGPRSYCRYGFDEVRVVTVGGQSPQVAPRAPWERRTDGSWRLRAAGSYLTGNDRSAAVGPCASPTTPLSGAMGEEVWGISIAGLATPTTPNYDGEALTDVDPPWLPPPWSCCDPRHPGGRGTEPVPHDWSTWRTTRRGTLVPTHTPGAPASPTVPIPLLSSPVRSAPHPATERREHADGPR